MDTPSPESSIVNLQSSIGSLALITGCGRSGTVYIARCLCHLGIDLPHERMGAAGTVDWREAPNAEQYSVVLHQIRAPLPTIGSICTINATSWGLIQRVLGDTLINVSPFEFVDSQEALLRNAMRYYVHWNRLAAKHATLSYRVEDTLERIDEIVRLIRGHDDHRVPSSAPVVAGLTTHVNSRPHPAVTWHDLFTADLKLCGQVTRLARKYGYDVTSKA